MMILRNRPPRRGSAAIVAVAVIVIVGFLGAALMGTIQLGSHEAVGRSHEVQAELLADAGIEWAVLQGGGTSHPISLAGGTFEVVQDGEDWVAMSAVGQATRQVRCRLLTESDDGLTEGLTYVNGSRKTQHHWQTQFLIMNTSEETVRFNQVRVTWGAPEAYFEAIDVSVLQGQSYGIVWDYLQDSGQQRFGSGETRQLNSASFVDIPAHHTAEMTLGQFRQRQGHQPSGGLVNMSEAELTIDFFHNSSKVGSVQVLTAPEP